MKVKDVMHKGVDWVSPNTPVTELAKLMREHDIGCIPIGEDDQLVGMGTERDVSLRHFGGRPPLCVRRFDVRVRQERFGPSLKHARHCYRDSRRAARSNVE